mgnify:CR=1 FL=1
MSLKAGSTAKDLLEQTGLDLVASEESWGWYLSGIKSPLDGKTYKYDPATRSYWQFYVNGKSATVGAGNYELQEGDAVTFMYGADADASPVRFLGLSMLSAPMSTATILAGARQAVFLCPKALLPRTLLRRS